MSESPLPRLDALPPGTVVLVTGAARGVGAACAHRFAAAGAAVILADQRLPEAEQHAQASTARFLWYLWCSVAL
jgi:NAD(P)-dependent dehydrogenase (short-subunit alcohol dehydrogenase family)